MFIQSALVYAYYLLPLSMIVVCVMLPELAAIWAVTVLFEKLLLSVGLNLLLVIPGVLVANTPFWEKQMRENAAF